MPRKPEPEQLPPLPVEAGCYVLAGGEWVSESKPAQVETIIPATEDDPEFS